MHYDKSGIWTHILQCYIQFVQPTPEIWMLSGLQKQNRPLYTVEHSARFLFVMSTIFPKSLPTARYITCNLTIMSLQTQKLNLLQ